MIFAHTRRATVEAAHSWPDPRLRNTRRDGRVALPTEGGRRSEANAASAGPAHRPSPVKAVKRAHEEAPGEREPRVARPLAISCTGRDTRVAARSQAGQQDRRRCTQGVPTPHDPRTPNRRTFTLPMGLLLQTLTCAQHWRSPASCVRLPAPLVRCNALLGTGPVLQVCPTMIFAHTRRATVEAAHSWPDPRLRNTRRDGRVVLPTE